MAPVRGGRFAQDVIRRDDSLLIRERRCGRTAYEREMFLTCRVSGLMPAKSASVVGVPYLVYRTEGWRALTDSSCFRPIDDALITDVESRLRSLRTTLKAYLLIPGHLVLDPEFVFVNSEGSLAFIYRPGEDEDGPDSAAKNGTEQELIRRLRGLRTSGQGSMAQSKWDDFRRAAATADSCDEAADNSARSFRREDPDSTSEDSEKKRRPDFYTIAVTLFLVGVTLAVFMILKSGALDQLIQSIPVIGGG